MVQHNSLFLKTQVLILYFTRVNEKIIKIFYLGIDLKIAIKKLPLESVLMCYGTVKLRPVNEINKVSYFIML
jgi:hypothetical protein